MSAPRPTESECEDTIIEAATLAGWRVHAERPARTNKGYRTAIKGNAGWPDLALVRGRQFMMVELKRKPNQLDPAQVVWIDRLMDAGVDARVVWVPEQMQDLIDELVAPLKGTTS